MSSSYTRLEIVQLAVAQGGRGSELYEHAKNCLNLLLRSWAFSSKYEQLKKVGDSISLATGTSTVDLPEDFGFGMDNLLLGDERQALPEVDMDEFVRLGGFPKVGASTARPRFYMIDKNAGVIRFNCSAKADYDIIPIYYSVPANLPTTSTGDDDNVWFDDDHTLIQALVELIFQFNGDVREFNQSARAQALKGEFNRGTKSMSGGVSTLKLSSRHFKTNPRRSR